MQIKLKLLLMVLTIITFNIQYSILNSTLWEVNQDGSGDFTSIQAAINNAVHGDSILVYPGRYTEAVDYLGKTLSLFSLAITNGDDEYIEQTIVDAEQTASAVTIYQCDNAYFGGFTVTNGVGNLPHFAALSGGGIAIKESTANVERCRIFGNKALYGDGGGLYAGASVLILKDCFISGNKSASGGGIHLTQSRVLISGNTITGNLAVRGGGVRLYNPDTSVDEGYIFDTDHKNSVYLNNAINGNDISTAQVNYIDIRLYKATVIDQEPYFYYTSYSCGEIIISAEVAMIDQTANDLYVATWGANENSGLTPDDPLQSIAYALIKIKADHLDPRTIFIEEGVYSISGTNEMLPLHLKPYVTLTSLTEDTRWMIDAEGLFPGAISSWTRGDITVRNAVFKRTTSISHMPILAASGADWVTFENIEFQDIIPHPIDSWDYRFHTMGGSSSYNTYRNIHIDGNPQIYGIAISPYFDTDSWVIADRVNVDNVRQGGIGINLFQGRTRRQSVIVSNSLITNCHLRTALTILGTYEDVPPDYRKILIVNNTLTGNTGESVAEVMDRVSISFYNNIIWGNDPNTIVLRIRNRPGVAHFSHNLFQNGLRDILTIGNYPYTYDNFISGDPLFVGEGNYPYQFSEGSPAINAGTTDIPGYTFEEYDLAGEPRIVGDSIDLGAYEFQPVSAESPGHNEIPETKISSYAYPNPVKMRRGGENIRCTISFDMPSAGDVIVAVYNVKGQRVKTLINAYTGKGEYNVYWDGTDNSGNRVGSGMYMYRIETADMEATGSIMLVK